MNGFQLVEAIFRDLDGIGAQNLGRQEIVTRRIQNIETFGQAMPKRLA